METVANFSPSDFVYDSNNRTFGHYYSLTTCILSICNTQKRTGVRWGCTGYDRSRGCFWSVDQKPKGGHCWKLRLSHQPAQEKVVGKGHEEAGLSGYDRSRGCPYSSSSTPKDSHFTWVLLKFPVPSLENSQPPGPSLTTRKT